MKKFVIFTPVLNSVDFIGSAIDSIRCQTYANWRHVILDGGSTDGTLDIVRAKMEDDDRIVCFSGPDTGMYDALLSGFAGESGDVFGWLNADDLYPQWAFAEAARVFSEEPDTEWITGFPCLWDEQGRLRAVVPTGYRPRALIARGWFHDEFLGSIQQESIFFRPSLLAKLTAHELECISRLRLAGDHALWKAFARHSSLRILPTALGGFRVHDRNMSRCKLEAYRQELRELGSPFPPRWMRRFIRSVYDLISAYDALRIQRASARMLYASERKS